MGRGVVGSARLIHNELLASASRFRSAFITLTYRPDVDWQPHHISKLIDCYRKWHKRHGVKMLGVWRMEPHASGRPHYHLVLWLPRGITPPMPDKQGWWPHGMTNAKWARSPVGYLAKYCAKPSGDVFPKGARIWGAVGLTASQRAQVQWCVAPRWLRRMTDPNVGVRRVTRKIKQDFISFDWQRVWYRHVPAPEMPDLVQRLWCCAKSGFTFESPYEFGGFDASGLVLNRRENPKCWSPEGDQFFYGVAA